MENIAMKSIKNLNSLSHVSFDLTERAEVNFKRKSLTFRTAQMEANTMLLRAPTPYANHVQQIN